MPIDETPILDEKTLKDAIKYIDECWKKLEAYNPKDDKTLIGLPGQYVVPSVVSNDGFSFKEMYYWDSYFIILGLLESNQTNLAKDIIVNELYLIDKFGMVPNASRYYMLSRSQPPTLTLQAFALYEKTKDLEFLTKVIESAIIEYENVWTSKEHPMTHNVFEGLSRYYDINVLHDLAEAESGWDFTPRFNGHCLDYIPIDLNSLLWKYESDFEKYFKIIGDEQKSNEWKQLASKRKNNIDKYLWDDEKNFYFDYDYKNNQKSSVYSLAAFLPMFVGMADKTQADKLFENLILFETSHGLSTTPPKDGYFDNKQWAAPNGWAPLHYFVIMGLDNYGYSDRAKLVALKWIDTNLIKFAKTGYFQEKYNVVDIAKEPASGVYPDQVGFGWTNGVFRALASKYT